MFKLTFGKGFILCFGLCAVASVALAVCTPLFAGITFKMDACLPKTQATTNQPITIIEEAPFACNPKALDQDQRARYKIVTAQLLAAKQEVHELPDGYALRFDSSAQNIKDTAEFITYERACCPFFDFEISVEKNNGALWLKIKGREGVKAFIKDEFGL